MRRLRPWIIGAALGALGLAMLPLSGLVPHDATGRGGVAGWYQGLAVRQSVTLRSLTITPPDLSDPAMAARAAGHYELVCAACHGSPAAPAKRIAQDLWPGPPALTQGHWRPPARLFQVVKHGIRHSAMPGWPAQERDDEVWDMVAFLRLMPGLSAEDYRRMAGTARCADCHGERGEGRDGIPRLDIQTPEYLADALRAYRDGSRQSGAMIAVARGLSDQDIDRFAREFGREIDVALRPLDAAGEIATRGLTARDIPACLSCHGPAARRDYPRLTGQDPRYLRRQLELFVTLQEERGGPHADTMTKAARWLQPDHIAALAAWLGRD